MNIRELFEEARNDPSLQSTLDIQGLLNRRGHTSTVTPETSEPTLDVRIAEDVYHELVYLGVTPAMMPTFSSKLCDYTLITELHQFKLGKYIRWIHREPTIDASGEAHVKLERGGILIAIHFKENGVQLQILVIGNIRYTLYLMFDACAFFQKWSEDEKLSILTQYLREYS
jgi:hypothetical protein